LPLFTLPDYLIGGGCLCSPILFNLFINDLLVKIKELEQGVCFGDNEMLSVLAYADDIVVLSETEEGLQHIIDEINNWCSEWDIEVNCDKSGVMCFGTTQMETVQLKIHLGQQEILQCDTYRYLGIVLNSKMDMKETAKATIQSAGRALGLLMTKVKMYGGLPFKCYSKLYDALVGSIIEYGASVWGTENFKMMETLHNRAARFYLGLPISAPTAGVLGDL
jgi:hypothetical protein